MPISPIITFRLLALVTYYGDESVLLEAARRSDWVLHNVRSRFDDDLVVEYGLAVLAHCAEATRAALRSPDAESKAVVLNASMRDLVAISLSALKKQRLTHNTATHALALLTIIAGPTLSHAEQGVVFPSGLFVALTKSGDPSIHATAFDVLLRLGLVEAPGVLTLQGMAHEPPILSPTSVPDLDSPTLPSDIRTLLRDFGIQRCETFQKKLLQEHLALSLVTLNSNGDIYTFGWTMAENLPFISLLDRTHPRVKELLRLITNALPAAAQALRARGGSEAAKRADTVQLFYFNETLPSPQVSSFAKEVMARSPLHTYAFVIKSQHEGGAVAIPINPRNPSDVHLSRRAYVHTIRGRKEAGWIRLRSQDPANRGTINDGVSSCRDVVQIAEEYLRTEPPPDALDLPYVLEVQMFCKLMMNGVSSDDDLNEIRVSLVHIAMD